MRAEKCLLVLSLYWTGMKAMCRDARAGSARRQFWGTTEKWQEAEVQVEQVIPVLPGQLPHVLPGSYLCLQLRSGGACLVHAGFTDTHLSCKTILHTSLYTSRQLLCRAAQCCTYATAGTRCMHAPIQQPGAWMCKRSQLGRRSPSCSRCIKRGVSRHFHRTCCRPHVQQACA